NKAIEKGVGPNWLFDIDSLTKSMNYVPLDAGTNSNNFLGTKDAASQEVKKDVSSLRYIALPNWVQDAFLESSSSKPQDGCSPEVPEGSGNTNPTASTSNPSAEQMETLTVEIPILIVSSPALTACLNDSPEPSSDARLISKRVANLEETPSLDNILSQTNRFEDIFRVTTSSDEAIGVEADNLRRSLMLFKTQAGWKLCRKSFFNSKSKMSGLWLIVLKGSDPLGWVLKNKKDERGIVVRNKARLVAQGHIQEEGIDYDEVFAPVARIEAIRLFLAYALFMGFTVYQMDVKSDFLYGIIDEEVYVMQPYGFQDPAFPAKVYKVEKAMYGLHQAPRAWHQVTPKECHLHAVKRIFRYLKGYPKLGLWYPKASPFDLVAYSDSDYGGASQDRVYYWRKSVFG
nr:putative ribonuclease H-like domain-containing protein [Tanacetum cinerariifolium]